MNHLQPFQSRKVLSLPTVKHNGWQLKRYGILSEDRKYNAKTVSSALDSALERLPVAGRLDEENENHGVGFQIIHFAEVAVVSPVFYWMWGSVLANVDQMRAQWEDTERFKTGVKEVVGCVWEMEIVCFEVQSWKHSMLIDNGNPGERCTNYLNQFLPSSDTLVLER